jgi:DNA-binding MarR family transcriptional regulator
MLDHKFPDHIGWLLWRASQDWTLDFVARMQGAGHLWFTTARSALVGQIAPRGTKQALLVDRLGTTKQAVQQLIDGLEAEGIVERIADPDDRRGRIVRLSETGRAAMLDADRIKLAIEAEYRSAMAEGELEQLADLLGKLRRSRRNPVA